MFYFSLWAEPALYIDYSGKLDSAWGIWTVFDFLNDFSETKIFYAVRSIGKGFYSLISDLSSDIQLVVFDFGTVFKFYVNFSNCCSQNTCITFPSFSLFLSECFPYLSESMFLQCCQLVILSYHKYRHYGVFYGVLWKVHTSC